MCTVCVCEWWGHPLHTFIPAQWGPTWNQLAGVRYCCEVARWGRGERDGDEGGWWFSQPHQGPALARVSLSPQAALRSRSQSATHQTRPDGTPGGKKYEELGGWGRERRLTDRRICSMRRSEEREQWRRWWGVNWALQVYIQHGGVSFMFHISLYWKHTQMT